MMNISDSRFFVSSSLKPSSTNGYVVFCDSKFQTIFLSTNIHVVSVGFEPTLSLRSPASRTGVFTYFTTRPFCTTSRIRTDTLRLLRPLTLPLVYSGLYYSKRDSNPSPVRLLKPRPLPLGYWSLSVYFISNVCKILKFFALCSDKNFSNKQMSMR